MFYSEHDYLTHINHYAVFAKKYEAAAKYPWFLVAPDPPDPDHGGVEDAFTNGLQQ